MRPVVLTEPVAPEALVSSPGIYAAKDTSPAYGILQGLAVAGEARDLGSVQLEDGHHMIAIEVGPRHNAAGAITIGAEFFAGAKKDYENWEEKWWREAIQNSVDASSTEVHCKVEVLDENEQPTERWQGGKFIRVSCGDDGVGMTEETLLNKFLVLGRSGKGSDPGSVGGFGKAKELLLLPWVRWSVATKRIGADEGVIVEGHGIQYDVKPFAMAGRHGTLLTVLMAIDEATTEHHAISFIGKCNLPGVMFYVNDKPYKAKLKPGDLVRTIVSDDGFTDADVYYDKRSKMSSALLVRVNGMYMHERWISSDIKGTVIVELKARSTEVLTANRDGIAKRTLRYALDDFQNQLAADTKTALRKKQGILRERFAGAGKFTSVPREKQRDILWAMERTAPQSDGSLSDEQRKALLSQIQDPDENTKLIDLRPTRGAISAMMETKMLGAVQVSTLAWHASWNPDFFLYNEIEGWKVPVKFRPEKMTPALRKLARFWAELCRFVLIQLNHEGEYGVGWIFDNQTAAAHQHLDGEHWLLLNPFIKGTMEGRGGTTGTGEMWQLSNPQHINELYALAVHEATHMADGITYHDESFATAFTWNVAKTANRGKQIEKIRKSVVARAARPGIGISESLSESPEENPAPPGARYWPDFGNWDQEAGLSFHAAVTEALIAVEDSEDRDPIAIFMGTDEPILRVATVRAHSTWADRYVLEIEGEEDAPADIMGWARKSSSPHNLAAVVRSGRLAPGELSEAEVRRRIAARIRTTGHLSDGWIVSERDGAGELNIEVDDELWSGAEDDERISDDDAGKLAEARHALESQRAAEADEPTLSDRVITALEIDPHGPNSWDFAEEIIRRANRRLHAANDASLGELAEIDPELFREVIFARMHDFATLDPSGLRWAWRDEGRAPRFAEIIGRPRVQPPAPRHAVTTSDNETVARAAIVDALDMTPRTPEERELATRMVDRIAYHMASHAGEPDWARIAGYRSAPDFRRQAHTAAYNAGLGALDSEGRTYSLKRMPAFWAYRGEPERGRVPVVYTRPRQWEPLEVELARALNVSMERESAEVARMFIAEVWDQVLDSDESPAEWRQGFIRETDWFDDLVNRTADRIALRGYDAWSWIPADDVGQIYRIPMVSTGTPRAMGLPSEEEIPPEARGIAEAMATPQARDDWFQPQAAISAAVTVRDEAEIARIWSRMISFSSPDDWHRQYRNDRLGFERAAQLVAASLRDEAARLARIEEEDRGQSGRGQIGVEMRPPRKGERGWWVRARSAADALVEVRRELESADDAWLADHDHTPEADEENMISITVTKEPEDLTAARYLALELDRPVRGSTSPMDRSKRLAAQLLPGTRVAVTAPHIHTRMGMVPRGAGATVISSDNKGVEVKLDSPIRPDTETLISWGSGAGPNTRAFDALSDEIEIETGIGARARHLEFDERKAAPFQLDPNELESQLVVGSRVKLLTDVDRYPEFIARKGATGSVVLVKRRRLSVKMDKPIEGAEEWDNTIHWVQDEELEDLPREVGLDDTDDATKRFSLLELNPTNNPAWVTSLFAKHYEVLEANVPSAWLPKLSKVTKAKGKAEKITAALKEYGCGVYGCVLPTLEKSIVVKLTTDSSEYQFAKDIAHRLAEQVTVDYHLVIDLPDKYKGRSTYLLWRDAADHVGQLDKVSKRKARVIPAIDAQHAAAQEAYVAIMDGKPSKHLIDAWVEACREMGKQVPELTKLANGMITNLRKNKVFMGDVHAGNIGLVGKRWLIVDPGNVAVLR